METDANLTDVDLLRRQRDYARNRATRLSAGHSEMAFKLESSQREAARLLEIVKAYTEPNDEPLWRRIANQRYALRVETGRRLMYEKRWRESSKQIVDLKQRLRDIEESN